MFTIFDLMRPGAGMDAMARQFGLTQDQAQRATEALLPAFMLGLQRSAGNPNAFANLMGAMTPGAAAPSTSQPQAAGSQALGQLFGPPELTRQIAEQAAHWSGVSAQVMQQMMPIVAGAVIGGLSKFSEVMRDQAASPQRRGRQRRRNALRRVGRDDAHDARRQQRGRPDASGGAGGAAGRLEPGRCLGRHDPHHDRPGAGRAGAGARRRHRRSRSPKARG